MVRATIEVHGNCDGESEGERMTRQERRADMIARGLCVRCGGPVGVERRGRTLCARCSDAEVRKAAFRRAERAERGLCKVCGKAAPIPGLQYCRACQKRHVEAMHKGRLA